MTQYGFYVDANNCSGCHTCQVACKDVNRLEVGQNFRKVYTFCTGSFPDVSMYHVSIACNHCENPACIANCPTGAMYKEDEMGLVLHDDDACIGCDTCVKSCPYEAPVHIDSLGIVKKCDACVILRMNDEEPSCVASCPMRAIEFGDIEELRASHPEAVADFEVIPDSTETSPNIAYTIKECMLDSDYDQVILQYLVWSTRTSCGAVSICRTHVRLKEFA